MTPNEIKEFIKCKNNCTYFIETYCQIQHPIQGLVPFQLYNFQKDLLNAFQQHRFNITNKSRQVGLSTLSASYSLWLALFHKKKTIIIISIKDEDSMEFLKKIKTAYDGLPEFLKDDLVLNNQHKLEFSTGSVINSVASGSSAARGRTPSLLIIDECVAGDTLIKVKNKITGEELSLSIEDFYRMNHG